MYRDHRYRKSKTGRTWEPKYLRFPESRDRVIIHRLRKILATGGNATSAKYSGVRVNKITVLAFVYNGCLAAIAGTLYAGRAHSARWDFGSGVEMNVIAAVVLGGTAMSGGTGSAIGALIGSFLIMMIDNGLVIGGLGVAQQTFMRGIIIILAVALSEIGRMKKRA